MESLIAELERATEGSRGLDITIASLMGHKLRVGPWMAAENPMEPDYPATTPVPFYTTSLDAALTLVPEGSYIRMTINRDKKAWVWVECAEDEKVAYAIPALALGIASLRARQAMKEGA